MHHRQHLVYDEEQRQGKCVRWELVITEQFLNSNSEQCSPVCDSDRCLLQLVKFSRLQGAFLLLVSDCTGYFWSSVLVDEITQIDVWKERGKT
jgi:hypothetical protein